MSQNPVTTPRFSTWFMLLVVLTIGGKTIVAQQQETVVAAGPSKLATPTPEQEAWQDLEIGMFIHFGMETFQDTETDDFSTPIKQFNPPDVDTDQWVRVAESMHAKYIILVAKHVGGFCLWQTDSSPYSIKKTPWRDGKGDILGDLAESCRKRGMLLGVYVYPGDLYHGSAVSSGGKTDDPSKQEQYTRVYRQQLTEVLSQYGPMMEVWFDGSVRKEVVDLTDILDQHAPHAMKFNSPWATIRWIGNEYGVAPYPAWSAVPRAAAESGVAEVKDSDPDGDTWLPNECDGVIRDAWFWNSKNAQALKSVEQLMDIYYRSVGHGANLLLNIGPDVTGRIPESDAKRAAEFGAEITRRFGVWIARTSGRGPALQLTLDRPTVIDHVITMEDIRHGERIREYVIEGFTGNRWHPLAHGSMIGHKKIDGFKPVVVSKIRLRVAKYVGTPMIREMSVYNTTDQGRRQESSEDKNAAGHNEDAVWHPVGQWDAGSFEQGRAEWEVDLTDVVDEARQYELLIQPAQEGDRVEVRSVTLVLQGQDLPPHFVKRVGAGGVFNVNVTATPAAQPRWCVVRVLLQSDQPRDSSGSIHVRKRPL